MIVPRSYKIGHSRWQCLVSTSYHRILAADFRGGGGGGGNKRTLGTSAFLSRWTSPYNQSCATAAHRSSHGSTLLSATHLPASTVAVLQIRLFSAASSPFSRRGDKRGKSSSTSRSKDSGGRSFQLDALPYSVSPQEALQKFQEWATKEQGLDYLLQRKSLMISAAYCPVWSFDVNLRFVVERPEQQGGRRSADYTWKPEAFETAYGSSQQQGGVIFMPGLSAYSGYTYRRSLVNSVHSTTLVFRGTETQPFGEWMLRDMKLSEHQILQIFPDPWNATRGRAWTVVRENLQAIAMAELPEGATSVKVQSEVVSSRRVYMPTYVIDYKVLGIEYQAFVSGCDQGAGVSGESHKVVDYETDGVYQASAGFLSRAASAARQTVHLVGGRGLFVILQLVGSVLARLLVRLPLISVLAGTFVGFRKVIQPFFNRRMATAEWERQREHEATMQEEAAGSFDYHQNDFVDTTGAARRYFEQHREQILRSLSGEAEREKGDFDWYAQWEQWAREQWAQQQQQYQQQWGSQWQQQYQQQQQQQQWQQQQQSRTTRPKKVDFQWDFDPNDPYSVLGVPRTATKKEISAAYRKQMLKYHPDTQGPKATEAQKLRAEERSKLINEAYKMLKK